MTLLSAEQLSPQCTLQFVAGSSTLQDLIAELQTSCSRHWEMVTLTEINGAINPFPLHQSVPKGRVLTERAMMQEYVSDMKDVHSC